MRIRKAFRRRKAVEGKPGALYKAFKDAIGNVGASRMVVDNAKNPASAHARVMRATAAKKPYKGALKKQ